MNYWLFTVTQQRTPERLYSAEEILDIRLADKFWGLGERTPNRRAIRKGDKIVFYVGIPNMVFAASAELGSDYFSLSEDEKKRFAHGETIFEADYGVLLDMIQKWDTPRVVKELLPNLLFIDNKVNWGAYFQGGIRQLSEEDYRTIVENRLKIAEPSIPDADALSQSQFALEAHLEEFIDKNWKHINFGANLEKYKVDDQNGRQFPAGPWSIDFLCIDRAKDELVILELKRGKSSDATVGQTLRYIGWVKENLAKPSQHVRGIIIAQEVDEALKYAVKSVPNVDVLTYRVDFKLSPFVG